MAHRRDIRRQTDGVPWDMYVIEDDLTVEEAKSLENALICIFTIEALANARHEIAQKNYPAFEKEFARAASICKIPLNDLYDVMRGDYK